MMNLLAFTIRRLTVLHILNGINNPSVNQTSTYTSACSKTTISGNFPVILIFWKVHYPSPMLQSMSGELYGVYIVIDCVFVCVFNRA